MFFGSEGLRPGWSLLLFLAITGLLLVIEAKVARRYFPQHTSSHVPAAPASFIAGEAVAFCTFTLAAWLVSRVERRRFGRYGLELTHSLPDFCAGLWWGVSALSLLVAGLHTAHLLVFDGVALHGRTALTYAAEWAAGFLLVGCFEEFLTRGFLQYTVSRGIRGLLQSYDSTIRHTEAASFWGAALLFSVLLFMAGHVGNAGETPLGILAVGVAGLTFAFSLWRTGTLWWAIGFHAAWDWAQSFLYGVADSGSRVEGHLLSTHPAGPSALSGGSVGPEGSIFAIPTLLLVCLVIHVTLPRRAVPASARP